MNPRPTIGRIVHFNGPSGPEAGIVIAVQSDTSVNLSVCNAGGTWRAETLVSEGLEPGKWSWPPRA